MLQRSRVLESGLQRARDRDASNVLRCLALDQVHVHDAATRHDLACDRRLTVHDLARARELRYQSAQENLFACELGGLVHDIGDFGQWKWIIVREIDGNARGEGSVQKTCERPEGVCGAGQFLVSLLKRCPAGLDDLSKVEMKLVSQIVDEQGRAADRDMVPVSCFRLTDPV